MLLSPEVLSLQILNLIFLVFASITSILSIKIYLKWDRDSTSKEQYNLEKQSFLLASIIKYIFILKLPLFLFFIFTMDKISQQLVGAMCAAGVVNATPYGVYILILKVLNIYAFGLWLVLNKIDINKVNLPYTKIKFALFIILFIFLSLEIFIEFVMFKSIDLNILVSCCSSIYSSSSSSSLSSIFSINTRVIIILFYILYILQVVLYFFKNIKNINYIFSLNNILFFIIAIISLIIFFGTYIYELPTHHCPFCLLQKDYNYVGYLIYVLLFLGTFFGMILSVIKQNVIKYYQLSLVFNFLYLCLVSAYVIIFYIKNGVWL